jgi:hypothetical protein
MVLLATAVGAWNLTQSSAQSTVETIRWIFAGNDVGSNTYRTLPSGRFERRENCERHDQQQTDRQNHGRPAHGIRASQNQGSSEVKVTAKEGKAQINKQGNTYEVDFKHAKVLFANDPFARIISGSYSYLAHDPFVPFGVIHAWLLRF